MNSRYLRLMCVLVAIAWHALALSQEYLRIDSGRLNSTMETMKSFGSNSEGGSARVAFSAANAEALDYLSDLMSLAGMTTEIDFAGNLIGTLEGQNTALPALITGSHIDTVPNGGHYDGIVGVMAAIEVARSLSDNNRELQHALEVIVWSNEEGGKTGSRSFNGSIQPRELDLPSLGERTLGEGMAYLGGNPQRLADNRRDPGSMAAYVELHVEQGAVLDDGNIEIGVVEGIVGIRRWNVSVEGFANHAGTTPMAQRQDALVAAAELIIAIRSHITSIAGSQVGTVGRITAEPGAPNVIPGRVLFSLEIRDLSMDKIGSLFAGIEGRAAQIAATTGTTIAFDQFYESPAAPTDPTLQSLVAAAADELGLSHRTMPSGAGHDAQSLAPLGPIAMIFIPSADGISHAPGEYSSPAEIAAGANLLLHTLLRMDEMLQ